MDDAHTLSRNVTTRRTTYNAMKIISNTYLFCKVYDHITTPELLETAKINSYGLYVKNKIYNPALTILQRIADVG